MRLRLPAIGMAIALIVGGLRGHDRVTVGLGAARAIGRPRPPHRPPRRRARRRENRSCASRAWPTITTSGTRSSSRPATSSSGGAASSTPWSRPRPTRRPSSATWPTRWTSRRTRPVYTFHLVTNAKWHDGEAFTADDVMFTINWTVQNYDAVQGLPARTGTRSRAPTRSTAPRTRPRGSRRSTTRPVEMTLAAPNAGFLYSLTDMANVILPEHILKDVTAADVEKIDFTVGKPGVTIGTGPYKLDRLHAPTSRSSSRPTPTTSRARRRSSRSSSSSSPIRRSPSPSSNRATSTSPSASRPGEFDRLSAIATLNVDLGRRTRASSGSCSRPRQPRGATSEVRQAFYTRSTARRSSTTSTRAAPRCSTTRRGSRSTTTSTSTSTTSTRRSSCSPTVGTRARRSSCCTTRRSPTPRRSCRSSRATCRPPA